MAIRFLANTTTDENIKLIGQIQSDADVIVKVDANNDTSGSKFEVLNGGNSFLFRVNEAGDATIASDLTVTGGDITLSGTGRIQGVDTVTDGTDAANKTYVDTQVAGVPQGTVTGSGVATRVALWNGTTDLTDTLRLVFSASETFFNNTTSNPVQMQNDGGVGTVKFEGQAVSNSSNIQIAPGTVSKPGINFGKRSGTNAQDTDTGIYSSAGNKVDIATGGTKRIGFSSSGTTLSTLNALSSAASVFLTSDSGVIKTRTASQVRSDIGAGTSDYSGWKLDGDTSGSVVSIGDGATVDFIGGTGIDCAASSGAKLTITNTAPDQTVALTGGTGITISGTYPNFTITNSSPSSGGTVTGSGSSGRVAFWNGSSSITSEADFLWNGNSLTLGGSDNASEYTIELGKGRTNNGYAYIDFIGDATYTDYGLRIIRNNTGANASSEIIHRGTSNFAITTQDAASFKIQTNGTNERFKIRDNGDTTIGPDGASTSTLYIDQANRKVGFRTQSPGSAFDVNGTIRVRNTLNVGDTTEQNLFVNGGSGGQYVKMGNYGTGGNYFGLTSSENQPKYTAAFGTGGKIVQDRRIITVKIAASAINTYHTDAGVEIIPSPGSGNIIWPMDIFIYRGAGSPGTGWPASNTAVGASFYMCDQVNTCSSLNRIANIASGVCKSNTGTWFWGRPVPLPSLNENPQIKWLLDNKNLRFKTAANISNATMDWYVRIEYLQMNITAGFTNNVDATIT